MVWISQVALCGHVQPALLEGLCHCSKSLFPQWVRQRLNMLMDQNKTKVKNIYMLRTVSTWFLCSYILNKHPASAGPQRSGHWAPHAAPEGSEAESPRSTREALWEQGFPLSPAFSPAHPRAQRHTRPWGGTGPWRATLRPDGARASGGTVAGGASPPRGRVRLCGTAAGHGADSPGGKKTVCRCCAWSGCGSSVPYCAYRHGSLRKCRTEKSNSKKFGHSFH